MIAAAALELDTAAGTLLLCRPDGQRQSLRHAGQPATPFSYYGATLAAWYAA